MSKYTEKYITMKEYTELYTKGALDQSTLYHIIPEVPSWDSDMHYHLPKEGFYTKAGMTGNDSYVAEILALIVGTIALIVLWIASLHAVQLNTLQEVRSSLCPIAYNTTEDYMKCMKTEGLDDIYIKLIHSQGGSVYEDCIKEEK